MLMSKQPCVYLLASGKRATLYIGVTSNLIQRVWQHKHDLVEGFSNDYRVHDLVWYEMHGAMFTAIQREKSLKRYLRAWKLKLIEEMNPDWQDLYPTLF